jgi:hypothetical protein
VLYVVHGLGHSPAVASAVIAVVALAYVVAGDAHEAQRHARRVVDLERLACASLCGSPRRTLAGSLMSTCLLKRCDFEEKADLLRRVSAGLALRMPRTRIEIQASPLRFARHLP